MNIGAAEGILRMAHGFLLYRGGTYNPLKRRALRHFYSSCHSCNY
jgi:hypothetical protein